MKKYENIKNFGNGIGPIISKIVPEKFLLLTEIRKKWVEIAGLHAASHSFPGSLSNKKLIVYVDDSGWLNEFSFLKDTLLGNIIKSCKKMGALEQIESIKFYLGEVKKKENVNRFREEYKVSPDKLEKIEKTVKSVNDPVLKNALKRYFIISSLAPESKDHEF